MFPLTIQSVWWLLQCGRRWGQMLLLCDAVQY